MANPSKQKGTRFEREVAEYLKANGFPEADRDVLRGAKDCGDIRGVPGWTLEAKNRKQMNLAGAVDEAQAESENAGTENFAAIVKRPRKRVNEAYVVFPLWLFCYIFGEGAGDGQLSL